MAEIRKRCIEVIDFVGHCPVCKKQQCANSAELADMRCTKCNIELAKRPEVPI